jgi:hypothetical protein
MEWIHQAFAACQSGLHAAFFQALSLLHQALPAAEHAVGQALPHLSGILHQAAAVLPALLGGAVTLGVMIVCICSSLPLGSSGSGGGVSRSAPSEDSGSHTSPLLVGAGVVCALFDLATDPGDPWDD